MHIVVNTIHPETGLTASLKYTKEKLSHWAEAYERAHGIHCEERIRNNERRKELAATRATEPAMPFEPVKHRQTSRGEWIEKKALLERMKELRAEIRPVLPQPGVQERKALASRHRAERDVCYQNARGAVDQARSAVFTRYRPRWRDLYRVHRKETKHLATAHPFDRAVFVFTQRERLGNGRPLSFRQMVNLIVRPDRLLQRVEAIQAKERRSLAREEKTEKKQVSDRLWQNYKTGIEKIRDRQKAERFAQVSEREAQLRTIVTFELAKESLLAERTAANDAAREFDKAVNTRRPGQTAEVGKIKRQMEEWRRRNQGPDYGREM